MSSPLYARDTDTGQMKELEAELVDGKYALLISDAVAAGVRPAEGVLDSTGTVFYPDSCSHTYTYSAQGELLTDTASYSGSVWIKTYGYVATNVTSESLWVKQ